jgi:MFS family permease
MPTKPAMSEPKVRNPLFSNRSFLLLWSGQSVSLVGSQITTVALPLAAAVALNANAVEMGILIACSRLPYLLLGLVAGVWVDRLSRRRVLIICNLGQALTLSVIPVSAFTDGLVLPLLYAVAFGTGSLAVFADIASLSLMPMVVSRQDLTRGQSALETSQSLSQVVGPALAGWLVQILSAPVAILADALSFIFSASTITAIDVRGGVADRKPTRAGLLRQVMEGARAVFGNVILRHVTLCTASFIFFFNASTAVFVLYLYRGLGLAPSLIGSLLAVGALGGLLGSAAAPRLGERLGVGKVLAVSVATAGIGSGLAVVTDHPLWLAVTLVIVSQAVLWFALQIYNVLQVPVRYALTVESIHGRVNATIRTTVWGLAPIGALSGGLLGDVIGLRGSLAFNAIGGALASLWIILSPVRKLGSLDSYRKYV